MEPPPDRRRLPEGARSSVWRAPDGWEHRRLDWPAPDAPRGSLLFAGGRGDFVEKYLEAQGHWRARGWRVTAFDWRGQGASRGTIAGGHLDTLDILVDDMAALIGAWRGEHPGPHVVVAHSMGGHVLLRTLAERRPRLDAAVLIAPMVMINSRPLPPRLAGRLADLLCAVGLRRRPAWKARPMTERGSTRAGFLTGSTARYQDELWWWDREPGYNLGAPSWGWLRAAFRSSARLDEAALAGIDVPLLFVGTERDRLVSPAAIRRAAGQVPGAELVMFPDAGHEILRERDEIRLAAFARVDAFLEARAPA